MKFGSLSKKNKNLQLDEPEEYGDCWTYTCFKRESGLFIAFQSGKRAVSTCADVLDLFFDRMNLPTPDEKISIYTAGNIQYTIYLLKLYCEPCLNYGQMIKVKEKNTLVCVVREKIFGNPHVSSISTSVVEGYNNKIHQRLSRFGRKTASFSKSLRGYIASLNIFQFVHNFIEIKTDSQSPAMLESITDHQWNWTEFLSHHVQL
jgi:IS1 family transposase